jgi:hypothetical protein
MRILLRETSTEIKRRAEHYGLSFGKPSTAKSRNPMPYGEGKKQSLSITETIKLELFRY